LKYWDEVQEERRKAKTSLQAEDLEWVRTKQDWKTALVCAPEIGFATSGVAMVSEIPPRWHTGKHSHGEEAIFIVQGKGFSLVDDLRYDWDAGSCVFMPYGSVHQHFNVGEEPVFYFSVMALPLERFAGLAKIMQYEEARETATDDVEGITLAESEVHPEYGRIVLRLKDAPSFDEKEAGAVRAKREDEFTKTMPKEMKMSDVGWHRSRSIEFMLPKENNFKAREVMITSILCDKPGMYGGRHGHMEALLYVLQGEGYSVIDGEKIPWKKGTLLHVQGPQTVHQHFNTGQVESQQLRIHFGLRSLLFQPAARRVFPYKYYAYSSYQKK
jgi:quercetin dioxygenase-like cupin family protein